MIINNIEWPEQIRAGIDQVRSCLEQGCRIHGLAGAVAIISTSGAPEIVAQHSEAQQVESAPEPIHEPIDELEPPVAQAEEPKKKRGKR
jgi:hypothetical protein